MKKNKNSIVVCKGTINREDDVFYFFNVVITYAAATAAFSKLYSSCILNSII